MTVQTHLRIRWKSRPKPSVTIATMTKGKHLAFNETPVRHLISIAASAALVLGLASCSSAEQEQPEETQAASTSTESDNSPYREAKTENLARVVSEDFPQTPTVISDPGYSGIESSKMFFDSSETVVVAGAGISQELRAASIGVVAHSPVLRIERLSSLSSDIGLSDLSFSFLSLLYNCNHCSSVVATTQSNI